MEYQDNSINDKKTVLDEMLDYFSDETENGLLLINYPMVEAFRDYNRPAPDKNYKDRIISLEEIKRGYKNVVGERGNNFNFSKYDLKEFEGIVYQNIKKLNYIVNGNYEIIDYQDFINLIYSKIILNKEYNIIEKYKKVQVLCTGAFVYCIFLKKDYYNNLINQFN